MKKEKTYYFEATCINRGRGYVTATSKKEAIEKLRNEDWDDILDEDSESIEVDFSSISEDDES